MFFWAEAKTGPHVIMDLSPISNSTSAIQSMTPIQLKYNNQSKSILAYTNGCTAISKQFLNKKKNKMNYVSYKNPRTNFNFNNSKMSMQNKGSFVIEKAVENIKMQLCRKRISEAKYRRPGDSVRIVKPRPCLLLKEHWDRIA